MAWDDTRYQERRTEPKSSAGILKTGAAEHGSVWMQPSAPPLVENCAKSLFRLACLHAMRRHGRCVEGLFRLKLHIFRFLWCADMRGTLAAAGHTGGTAACRQGGSGRPPFFVPRALRVAAARTASRPSKEAAVDRPRRLAWAGVARKMCKKSFSPQASMLNAFVEFLVYCMIRLWTLVRWCSADSQMLVGIFPTDRVEYLRRTWPHLA